ncbi:MAG: hypothetical protein ACXVHB_28355 [Solirubrobacteraceae bacterium]
MRSEVPDWLPSRILRRSKMFELFVDAAPGLGELLTIGADAVRRRARRAPAEPADHLP